MIAYKISYIQQPVMQAGDVLFIPEGYWHQVESAGGTIAVNIWYESAASGLVLDSHMSEFYLTRLLQSKAADKAQEILGAIPCHPDLSHLCKTDNTTGLTSYISLTLVLLWR